MKYRLRSYDVSPPGGFAYTQVSGVPHEFPALPMIEAQAEVVLAFRKANGLPFATRLDCLRHIDHQTCARLGNDPVWCVPVEPGAQDTALGPTHPYIAPCLGCGAQWL
jgi:hypothetical protein